MASPESIKAGVPVAPAAPAEAKVADDAVAGSVEKAAASQAQLAATDGKPVTLEQPADGKKDPEKKGWIEIVLVNSKGKGIPGEVWEIKAPDGQLFSGTTDDQGLARLEGIEEGQCEVTFPRLDKEAWEPA